MLKGFLFSFALGVIIVFTLLFFFILGTGVKSSVFPLKAEYNLPFFPILATHSLSSNSVKIFILLICVLFIPVIYANQFSLGINSNNQVPSYISQDKFVWPIPGYTTISSYFGKRNSPTAGASTYHSGLDIPAPEGTYLYAIDDGYVSFASWGAGGRIYHCN